MAQAGREDAVAVLGEGYARVRDLIGALSDEEFERPATIGGGDWSAKDLVAHLTTWEELAIRSLEEFRRGETPWVETEDGPFSAPPTGKVDAFNAETVAEKRTRPAADVRHDAERVHADLLAAILELTDEEWGARAFYPTPMNRRRHLRSLLGSALGGSQGPFRHADDHLPDLEAFLRSLGKLGPTPEERGSP